MKKWIWTMAVAVSTLSGGAVAPAAAQDDAVLLVAPARFAVMQVAFDVARRYPTVLVSYQGAPTAPVLHVLERLRMDAAGAGGLPEAAPSCYPIPAARFPGRRRPVPADLRAIGAWCDRTTQIPVLEKYALITRSAAICPSRPRTGAGRRPLQHDADQSQGRRGRSREERDVVRRPSARGSDPAAVVSS
jgi:hypothetical protein